MMQGSTLGRVFVAMGFLVPVSFTETAKAQFGPYGYDYGGWVSAAAYGASVSRANTQSRIAAERHSQAQSRAMQQNLTVQQGIRSTLAGSAQARTQSMESRQQAARDWWFQRQVQVAQTPRPPVYGAAPSTSPGETGAMPEAAAPPADKDQPIAWPPVLQDPRFAQQRARVEAPYRRPASAGGPTVDDYRAMVDATAQMAKILKTMAHTMPIVDYQHTEDFLDRLATEARERAEQKAASPPAPKPAASEKKGP